MIKRKINTKGASKKETEEQQLRYERQKANSKITRQKTVLIIN